MHRITVDMETYYDQEYSLSKMTTEAYIRDPRFSVIGVSTKLNDEPAQWVTGPASEILDHLHSLPWDNAMAVGHNMMFDGAILSWRCGIHPKALGDTMLMSRAVYGTEVGHSLKVLAERRGAGVKGNEVLMAKGKRRKDFTAQEMAAYGAYCQNDVDLTDWLFNDMVEDGFPRDELRLIDITLRMFTEPVLELDAAHLRRHLKDVRERKQRLLDAAGVTDKKDLMSNPKFAKMLEQHGVTPPMKISATTGKETFAFAKTDEDFVALQDHPNDAVQTLVSARLGNKSTLEETRTERFIEIAKRGPLPGPIRYYAAHCLTGDAEVLTRDGWHSLQTWDGGDIMQWSPSGFMRYASASANTFQISEPIVAYASRYHRARYTMGHTLPTFSGRGVFTPRKAGEARALRFELPVSGVTDGAAGVTPDAVRLAVMVQADGSIRTGARGRAVRFGFRKARKISRCRELLARNAVPFTETEERGGAVRIRVGAKHFAQATALVEGKEKRFSPQIYDASHATKQAFLEELAFWDGSLEPGGGINYTSTSEYNARFVQTMAHLSNKAAYVSRRERTNPNWSPSHRVQIRDNTRTRVQPEHAAVAPFTGEVFCPSTETGYFLFRQNGVIMVTGNTGRWGGMDKINVQNLPSRGANAKQIKKGIMAPDGYVLIDADSAQIEARVLAWLAEQDDLVEAFFRKEDVYKLMASQIYGTPVTDVTKPERQVGKTVILGCGYGVGHVKLQGFLKTQAGADVTLHEAKEIVDIYRRTNAQISGLWKQCQTMLEYMVRNKTLQVGRPGVLHVDALYEGIKLPSGMWIRYPDLKREPREDYGYEYHYQARGKRRKYIYGGKCVENAVQALARCVVGDQMRWVAKRYRPILTVHDSIICCVREEEVEEAQAYIEDCMKRAPDWAEGLPVDCESDILKRYGGDD